MNPKKQNAHSNDGEDLENLGLDADHSSDNFSVNGRYNTDNDKITSNPGGEEDPNPEDDPERQSPLDQK